VQVINSIGFLVCAVDRIRTRLGPRNLPVPKKLTYLEDYTDEIEYGKEGISDEGDLVTDICEKAVMDEEGMRQAQDSPAVSADTWPNQLAGLAAGTRVDALDSRGNWFPGFVMEQWKVSSKDLPLIKQTIQECEEAGQTITTLPTEAGLHVRIHFDNYSPKWDEWLSARDFANGRIQPVYTHTARKTQIYHLTVYHRRMRDPNANPTTTRESVKGSTEPKQPASSEPVIDLVGVPFIIPIEPWRSCEHLYRHIVEQAFRFASTEEMRNFLEHALQPYLQKLYNTQLALKEARDSGNTSNEFVIPDGLLSSISWPNEVLPFTVRIASFGNVAVPATTTVLSSRRQDKDAMARVPAQLVSQLKYGREQLHWEGTPFPCDRQRPAGNLVHQKLCIVIDWQPLYRPGAAGVPVPSSVISSNPSRSKSANSLGGTNTGNNSNASTSSAENAAPQVDSRFVTQEYEDDESFATTMQIYRDNSSTSNLKGANSFTANSNTANVNPARGRDRGVSLQECLRAFAGQEELDENTWKCDRCKKCTKATVMTSLQRFPDTLIIHIKRFNMTARFGEKIKTLVTFPLRGLDLYQFSTHHMHKDKTSVPGSSQKPMSQESPQRYVYDLYGVTNHIGKYFE
jgi:hypothetical protein